MNFESIIWGIVTPSVNTLIPLFGIFFVFDCLRSLYQWTDGRG